MTTAPKPKIGLDRSKTGRAKGTPNKTTTLLKEATILAAEQVGRDGRGKEGLVGFLRTQAAKKNNGPFMALLGKVLPMQLTGADGNELKIIIQGPDAGLL